MARDKGNVRDTGVYKNQSRGTKTTGKSRLAQSGDKLAVDWEKLNIELGVENDPEKRNLIQMQLKILESRSKELSRKSIGRSAEEENNLERRRQMYDRQIRKEVEDTYNSMKGLQGLRSDLLHLGNVPTDSPKFITADDLKDKNIPLPPQFEMIDDFLTMTNLAQPYRSYYNHVILNVLPKRLTTKVLQNELYSVQFTEPQIILPNKNGKVLHPLLALETGDYDAEVIGKCIFHENKKSRPDEPVNIIWGTIPVMTGSVLCRLNPYNYKQLKLGKWNVTQALDFEALRPGDKEQLFVETEMNEMEIDDDFKCRTDSKATNTFQCMYDLNIRTQEEIEENQLTMRAIAEEYGADVESHASVVDKNTGSFIIDGRGYAALSSDTPRLGTIISEYDLKDRLSTKFYVQYALRSDVTEVGPLNEKRMGKYFPNYHDYIEASKKSTAAVLEKQKLWKAKSKGVLFVDLLSIRKFRPTNVLIALSADEFLQQDKRSESILQDEIKKITAYARNSAESLAIRSALLPTLQHAIDVVENNAIQVEAINNPADRFTNDDEDNDDETRDANRVKLSAQERWFRHEFGGITDYNHFIVSIYPHMNELTLLNEPTHKPMESEELKKCGVPQFYKDKINFLDFSTLKTQKKNLLRMMIVSYCLTQRKIYKPTARANWAYKGVQTVGEHFMLLHREYMETLQVNIRLNRITYVSLKTNEMQLLNKQVSSARKFFQKDFSKKYGWGDLFRKGFLTSEWGRNYKKIGKDISEILAPNWLHRISQCRSIRKMVSNHTRNLETRLQDMSSTGIVCPVETSNSAPGLQEYMDITATVTSEVSDANIIEDIIRRDIIQIKTKEKEDGLIPVLVNGKFIGLTPINHLNNTTIFEDFSENNVPLVEELREKKRYGCIHPLTCIALVDNTLQYVSISTSGGRLVSPYLLLRQPRKTEKLTSTFHGLYRQHKIEYLDALERESITIAYNKNQIQERFEDFQQTMKELTDEWNLIAASSSFANTVRKRELQDKRAIMKRVGTVKYMVLDQSSTLGIGAAIAPWLDRNALVRCIFLTQQNKQEITPITSPYNTYGTARSLIYGYTPVATTLLGEMLDVRHTNIDIMLVPNKYTQEDGVIFNADSAANGAFAYATHHTDVFQDVLHYQGQKFQLFTGPHDDRLRPAYMNENWLPYIGAVVNNNDTLAFFHLRDDGGKKVKTIQEKYTGRLASTVAQIWHHEDTYVDAFGQLQISNTYKIVTGRTNRIVVGDKITPRPAQKATIALLKGSKDMPHIKRNGVFVPIDIQVAPQTIAGRATVASIFEYKYGRAYDVNSVPLKATPFQKFDPIEYERVFMEHGMTQSAMEDIYDLTNDGWVKRPGKATVGKMSYMLLNHMAMDKQKKAGERARVVGDLADRPEGGYIGFMEYDAWIAHGAMSLVKKTVRADSVRRVACTECGLPQPQQKIKPCVHCLSDATAHIETMLSLEDIRNITLTWNIMPVEVFAGKCPPNALYVSETTAVRLYTHKTPIVCKPCQPSNIQMNELTYLNVTFAGEAFLNVPVKIIQRVGLEKVVIEIYLPDNAVVSDQKSTVVLYALNET